MKIGVLEFGFGGKEENSLVKLRNVFDFALQADELGYERFWLAEHHMYSRRLAWGNPISLVPVIAGFTSRIKVGTGGVLLRVHNPLDVASQFKLWNSIYNDRIDLGLANGGSFNNEMFRVTNPEKETFENRLKDLVGYLLDEESLLEKQIVIPPYSGSVPDIWGLSTSAFGFHRSLKFGMNYVRSVFHEKAELDPNPEGLLQFKKDFENTHHRKVKTILAVSGICLKDPRKLRDVKKEALSGEQNHFIGDLAYFRDKLPELAEKYQMDEILFRVMNLGQEEKLETLESLAEFLGD
ncbi:LLM class flavin-dependent oxidoreductase [Belliella marina]|uniref:LLM class flavin-dependent oxidoreductase n=1 Tax=Belliella marina TaxID=1644146 RepID=A0ABW4VH52_9BACT